MIDIGGDIVDRARASLEGVTPGPWGTDGELIGSELTQPARGVTDYKHGIANMNTDDYDEEDGPGFYDGEVYRPYEQMLADAEFIAAARTLVPELIAEVERLEAVVQRVRGLHASQGGGTPTGEYADICRECPSYHPCATLAALDGCCCHHQPITALPAATCDPCKLGRHIECEKR